MGGTDLDELGLANFRDAGGVEAAGGRSVRSGLLYRSAALSGASDEDLATLARLGVRRVFDLRTAMERERAPDRLPPGAKHIGLDLLSGGGEAGVSAMFLLMHDPPRASAELAGDAVDRFWLASYEDFVRLPSARSGLGRLYRALAAGEGAAVVHCTTGKDRTGWAVAVLLLLLGVHLDAVMQDYLRSDAEVRAAFTHLLDDFVARGGAREVLEPFLGVRPGYLAAALDAMRADYGSVDGYVRRGLGLDDAVVGRLRTRFLAPG